MHGVHHPSRHLQVHIHCKAWCPCWTMTSWLHIWRRCLIKEQQSRRCVDPRVDLPIHLTFSTLWRILTEIVHVLSHSCPDTTAPTSIHSPPPHPPLPPLPLRTLDPLILRLDQVFSRRKVSPPGSQPLYLWVAVVGPTNNTPRVIMPQVSLVSGASAHTSRREQAQDKGASLTAPAGPP